MRAAEAAVDDRTQSARFLLFYALAVCGGSTAYVPFLTILLPLRVSTLAPDSALTILAQIAFVGAIAASLGNILFGWASDLTGSRRPWIATGLLLSSGLLVAMTGATRAGDVIILIILWQLALNMMLGPLAAWAGDCVPDRQKGLLGGLLAIAPAAGALSGAVVTWHGLATPDQRLLLVAGVVVAMVSPLLLFGRPRPMPHLLDKQPFATDQNRTHIAEVSRMWLARLLVQISEASLFAFLLLWLRSLDASIDEHRVATIFTVVLAGSVGLALLVGRWSDRHNRPFEPLAVCAIVVAVGLAIMAAAKGIGLALFGYVVFGLASSVFLALHSTQTLRILPRPAKRGRDLGLFNLTNTGPSLIMPWLTMALVPRYGFDALFSVLTVLAVLSAVALVAMARVSRRNPPTPRPR